ncbi:hypothetical protein [Streptomyces flaveolus]|uniref:hypothetical protein n=1 Tax=Streptomyces flaveolus TaxID=67297 RepID=UPI003800BCA4
MNRAKVGRAKSAVLTLGGACALSLSLMVPTPAMAAGSRGYLNLHQCVYHNGSILYTNLLPNTANRPFNTGTNVSADDDSTVACGSGAGGWALSSVNSAVYNGDRFGNGRKYLNLHQCVYHNGSTHYTNLLPNTKNETFNTGTSISTTKDTALECGRPSGWPLNSVNSALYTADVTGASGRYLNLHQCVYNNGTSLYTNLLPNTGNTPFNTGTNVSNTADSSVVCAPGVGGWRLDTANSSVYAVDLLA